jgi:nicotinamidase-related amidase
LARSEAALSLSRSTPSGIRAGVAFIVENAEAISKQTGAGRRAHAVCIGAEVLRAAGIERLIIAGIVSDGSVSSRGYVRGIETVVLESCAAFDRPTRKAAITR